MIKSDLNHIVEMCAAFYMPRGFDAGENAPSTLIECTLHFKLTGRVKVWSGASAHTIFGSEQVNFAFRAWHDWHHINGQFSFDRVGEYENLLAQTRDAFTMGASPLALALLECEVIGQFDFGIQTGMFPVDQVQFTRDWLSARGFRL